MCWVWFVGFGSSCCNRQICLFDCHNSLFFYIIGKKSARYSCRLTSILGGEPPFARISHNIEHTTIEQTHETSSTLLPNFDSIYVEQSNKMSALNINDITKRWMKIHRSNNTLNSFFSTTYCVCGCCCLARRPSSQFDSDARSKCFIVTGFGRLH